MYIRKSLEESINNFLDKEPATATKQLNDTSKLEVLGDPLFDVEMNQMAGELGSDEKNAPTVAVTPGGIKGGNGPVTGQHQANFKDKTKIA
jgi:hypothetical protein